MGSRLEEWMHADGCVAGLAVIVIASIISHLIFHRALIGDVGVVDGDGCSARTGRTV